MSQSMYRLPVTRTKFAPTQLCLAKASVCLFVLNHTAKLLNQSTKKRVQALVEFHDETLFNEQVRAVEETKLTVTNHSLIISHMRVYSQSVAHVEEHSPEYAELDGRRLADYGYRDLPRQ